MSQLRATLTGEASPRRLTFNMKAQGKKANPRGLYDRAGPGLVSEGAQSCKDSMQRRH